MSLTVREVKAWLATLQDTDHVGIGEDDMTLRLADARANETALEIGMALSTAYLIGSGQSPDPEVPSPCVYCGRPIEHVNDGGCGFYAYRREADGTHTVVLFCWSQSCHRLATDLNFREASDRVWECCDVFMTHDSPCVDCGAEPPPWTTEVGPDDGEALAS